MRRVVSGSEVALTPESINALADQSLALEAAPVHNADAVNHFPGMIVDDATFERITEHFPPSLELSTTMATKLLLVRPKSPNVASGLKADLDLTFLGGMDPFSSLPYDANGEPVLTQLLVHYCKSDP
jgi:hypothetical protein